MSHDSPPLTPAAPGDTAGESLCSIAWLDALAESWERRSEQLGHNPYPDYTAGLQDALDECLEELRAGMESASKRLRSGAASPEKLSTEPQE